MFELDSTILFGHVLDELAKIPSESVHCVVTSPPYWGLRNYGTEPQVWPNSSPLCQDGHEWTGLQPRRRRSPDDITNSKQGSNTGTQCELPQTDYCAKCHAWRGELGLEPTPQLFIDHMVIVFREIRRTLRKDGTLWLNIGDSYAAKPSGSGISFRRDRAEVFSKSKRLSRGKGLKPKDLVGIPWMLAFALRNDGWYLRSDIIWSKPNPMPESVEDRPTKSHEYLFLLTKSARYYYDKVAIQEALDPKTIERARGNWNVNNASKSEAYVDQEIYSRSAKEFNSELADKIRSGQVVGRNRRTVWTIGTEAFAEAHFATFPQELVEICVKAGTSLKGVCGGCGAPWKRVIEKRTSFHSGSGKARVPSGWHQSGSGRHSSRDLRLNSGKHKELDQATGGDYDIRMGPVNTVETIAWIPTCRCNLPTVPAIVLDPFGGSGTTGLVATKLGRRFILIELKSDYVHISKRRIRKECGFLTPAAIQED